MERERRITCIRESVASFQEVRVAYLYGSFLTRDDFRDIDIGLFVEEGLSVARQESLRECVGISIEEALGFRHECDIRILNHAPVWFQFEVIRSGTPVFARSEAERFDRETAILIAYLDMKYTFDLFDSEYLARA